VWRLRMLATMPITRLNTGPSTLPDSQYSEGVSLWAPLEKIVAGRGWGGGVDRSREGGCKGEKALLARFGLSRAHHAIVPFSRCSG